MPVNGIFGRQAHECRQSLSLKEAQVQRQEEEIRELKAQLASRDSQISSMNATIQDQQQKLRGFGVF
jgi:septal ring factor EnvC (AmiA/AmiB activator)